MRTCVMAGMKQAAALELARGYHRAWSGGRIDEAAGYLGEGLQVEVPINSYLTKSSFMDAVSRTQQATWQLTAL